MKTKLLFISSIFLICFQAYSFTGYDIDLEIIAQIESGGNYLDYNAKEQAKGLYQIRPICLADYNQYHRNKISSAELWNPIINKKVATWYMQIRVPQLLKYYKTPVNLITLLAGYNFGSKHVGHWYRGGGALYRLPYITRLYIKKYKRLLKEKNVSN